MALNNDRDQYRVVLEKFAEGAIIDRHESNAHLLNAYFEKPSFREALMNFSPAPTTRSAAKKPGELGPGRLLLAAGLVPRRRVGFNPRLPVLARCWHGRGVWHSAPEGALWMKHEHFGR